MITTIIPTYQRPSLLKRAIESVLAQTYPNSQIYIYDNASGDETEDVVRALMKQDSRIKYHRHLKNIGMMANYQFALSQINTRYFSLLSDDDFLLPVFYELTLKGFEQFPNVAFSACGVKAIDELGQLVSEPLSHWNRDGYFVPFDGLLEMINHPLLPNGILFQHKFVRNIEIDVSKKMQMRWDTDYLLQVISTHPFVVNKQVGASFLLHPQGYSTSHFRQTYCSSRKFVEQLDATDAIKQRLMLRLEQFPKIKNKVSAVFFKVFCRFLIGHVQNCLAIKNYSIAKVTIFICQKRYGFRNIFLFLLSWLWILEHAFWLVICLRKIRWLGRKLSNKFSIVFFGKFQ